MIWELSHECYEMGICNMTTDIKKTDRRVVRTRSAIREAFLELLSETSFDKITITALAKQADVDRKTFYTHYSSVEALFEDVIRTQTEQSLRDIDFRDFLTNPSLYTRRLLSALNNGVPYSIDERRTVIDNVPIDVFLRCWTTVSKERIHKSTGPLPKGTEERVSILLEFYLGAVLNSYLYWLKQGTIPVEEAIDLIGDSVVKGLGNTFNRNLVLA